MPDNSDLQQLQAAIASGDPARAMPALANLRQVPAEQAIQLLLLGLEQEGFTVRCLSCAGLGVKRNEAGWQALVEVLQHDQDPNVRAEAANALASYGLERAWPLLKAAFSHDQQWLLELATLAIEDTDGTVRVGGTEILGRLVRDWPGDAEAHQARLLLQQLQQDPDHRVVAAALDGLQA